MSPLHFSLDNPLRICDTGTRVNGEQMRIVRLANGLTQVQVAEALGVVQSYVADMESGRRRISQRTAIAFATIINAHKTKGRRSKTA